MTLCSWPFHTANKSKMVSPVCVLENSQSLKELNSGVRWVSGWGSRKPPLFGPFQSASGGYEGSQLGGGGEYRAAGVRENMTETERNIWGWLKAGGCCWSGEIRQLSLLENSKWHNIGEEIHHENMTGGNCTHYTVRSHVTSLVCILKLCESIVNVSWKFTSFSYHNFHDTFTMFYKWSNMRPLV